MTAALWLGLQGCCQRVGAEQDGNPPRGKLRPSTDGSPLSQGLLFRQGDVYSRGQPGPQPKAHAACPPPSSGGWCGGETAHRPSTVSCGFAVSQTCLSRETQDLSFPSSQTQDATRN